MRTPWGSRCSCSQRPGRACSNMCQRGTAEQQRRRERRSCPPCTACTQSRPARLDRCRPGSWCTSSPFRKPQRCRAHTAREPWSRWSRLSPSDSRCMSSPRQGQTCWSSCRRGKAARLTRPACSTIRPCTCRTPSLPRPLGTCLRRTWRTERDRPWGVTEARCCPAGRSPAATRRPRTRSQPGSRCSRPCS